MSIPHSTKEDNDYRVVHVLRGLIIVGNTWYVAHSPFYFSSEFAYRHMLIAYLACLNITHDPVKYPEPSVFKLECYICQVDSAFDCSTNDLSQYAFGFGRRVRPSELLAEGKLWLTVVQESQRLSPPRLEFCSDVISY
ncbi:hypothetical protein BC628DRAFT_1404173 [Trametes gibbosa]|nr:hypothetical protein BC628DRAFT_1404173 [Trametes gibbosa]